MRMRKKSERESFVKQYEIGENFIRVEFSTGKSFLYTYESAGKEHVEEMKRLALVGDGLNSYINICVKKLHEV